MNIAKKLLILWISISLAIFTPFANAFNFGNWTKTFSKSYGSQTALGFRTSGKVTPSNPLGLLYSGVTVNAKPSALAKLYKKVGPTAAFAVAVTALIGAVDYVLDPDNNRIIYQDLDEGEVEGWLFQTNYNGIFSGDLPTPAASAEAIKDRVVQYIKHPDYPNCSSPSITMLQIQFDPLKTTTHAWGRATFNLSDCKVSTVSTQTFAVKNNEPPQDKYLSYETIGARVISDADSGSPSAQNDTHDAADPEKWTAPTYPYGNLEPEIDANAKEEECDPKKDAPNSCYRKLGSPLKADPDGTVEVKNPDGTTTKFYPDGTVERSGEAGGINDGIKETTYPDGTKVRTYPDGTKIITKPDGTITTEEPAPPDPNVKDPDGTSVVQAPDGSITKYFPDGSKKTIRPDGSTTLTQPDGTVTVTAPNGDTTTTNPDGTKVTTKADGTKETDTEFKLPKFCDWAAPVCELVDLVKKQFEEPDLPDPEELPDEQFFEPKEIEVDFGGGCPTDVSFDIGVMGFSKTVSFSWQPICDGAVFMNPIMQGIGALAGAYIMFGRGGHG